LPDTAAGIARLHRHRRENALMTTPSARWRSLGTVALASLAACGGGGDDAGTIGNVPPTVTLAAPATGASGVAVALSATAADADGTVALVEFFDGATKLGEDASSPYAFTWTPTSTGAHSLTARATDSLGATTTSAAVSVAVSPPASADSTPPTVALGAPANLASGLTGVVALTATATDDVAVTGVEFQIDGVQIGGVVTTAPYAASLDTSLHTAGQHVLRTRASDAAGNVSPWATALVQFGGSVSQPSGFTRNETWVTGLSNATAFAQAPDGRIFVAQQGGAIRVIKNGALLATPFASVTVDSTGERGVIGIALHPGFATNGFVYVYSTRIAGGASHNRISRFVAAGDVAAGADSALVDLPDLSSATNHNGGGMHFGGDGKLYVGVGENANPAQAQDLTKPFGKLLRFNEDGTIPTDNPFYATQTGVARAIWAYGLRNPFTFAVQAGTGRIHVNDVGQDTWEEINVGAAGANYGWPMTEGQTSTAGITSPLFTYKHSDASPLGSGPGGFFKGFAIAGGGFYPASGPFPVGYRDQYYFADFVSQFVGRLDSGNGNAAYSFARLSGAPVDLLVGLDGAVYVLTRGGVTRISAP
jgi:glucose/arabinose dehydrogenase